MDTAELREISAEELKELLEKSKNGETIDLSYANLRCADFGGAYLRNANLRCADLRFTDLSHADLRGADLRGAKMLICVMLN